MTTGYDLRRQLLLHFDMLSWLPGKHWRHRGDVLLRAALAGPALVAPAAVRGAPVAAAAAAGAAGDDDDGGHGSAAGFVMPAGAAAAGVDAMRRVLAAVAGAAAANAVDAAAAAAVAAAGWSSACWRTVTEIQACPSNGEKKRER